MATRKVTEIDLIEAIDSGATLYVEQDGVFRRILVEDAAVEITKNSLTADEDDIGDPGSPVGVNADTLGGTVTAADVLNKLSVDDILTVEEYKAMTYKPSDTELQEIPASALDTKNLSESLTNITDMFKIVHVYSNLTLASGGVDNIGIQDTANAKLVVPFINGYNHSNDRHVMLNLIRTSNNYMVTIKNTSAASVTVSVYAFVVY